MGVPFNPEALEIASRILPAADPIGVLRELIASINAEIVARAALASAGADPALRAAAEAAAYDAAERLDWARAASELVIALRGGEMVQ